MFIDSTGVYHRTVPQDDSDGGSIGTSTYQRYVYDVAWNDTTCQFTITYHWHEFVQYVESDSMWYYLYKADRSSNQT